MYLFPLPADYEKALMRKLGMTNDMRQKFKQVRMPLMVKRSLVGSLPHLPLVYMSQANLTKDKERELNDAIQAHFREWLQSSSLLRQIYDLSNLERDEAGAGSVSACLPESRFGVPPGAAGP